MKISIDIKQTNLFVAHEIFSTSIVLYLFLFQNKEDFVQLIDI